MPVRVEMSAQEPLTIECDALVVGAYAKDDGFELSAVAREADKRLGGHLASALTAAGFVAKTGSRSSITTLGQLPAIEIIVVGLGDKDTLDDQRLRRASVGIAKRLAERTTVVTALHSEAHEAGVSAVVEGYLFGAYRFKKYLSTEAPADREVRLLVPGTTTDLLERATALAEATNLARDLVNEPPDRLTPTLFAERATAIAQAAGLGCTVLDEHELKSRGFGGLLAVSSGSVEPPRLVELNYSPADPTGHVTLVGKGVTFDSGGLTIKPPAGMIGMKTDMGGGAAVIAAMSVLSRLGVTVGVRAIVPMTENLIGPSGMRIDDVLVHYGGRTTELNNADAEGRLILADALALASEETTDAIVDIATLTGHIVIGLGTDIAGLFSNDDALTEELKDAGTKSGEAMWPMPLFEPYEKDLASDVADQKNTGKREGGAVTAALFLQRFVGKGIPWAHLDIAGPSRARSDQGSGGTGFGTTTLIRWVEGRGR